MNELRQCMKCMEYYNKDYDLCPHCGHVPEYTVKELLHIEPGTLLCGRYIVGLAIGYGGFGITYIGWDTLLKRKVAIKEYMPSEFSTRRIQETALTISNNEKKIQQFQLGKEKFLREAKHLAKVGGIDGIVHVFDSFEANNTAYIIMEYLQGETLASHLEKVGIMTEEETLRLLKPIMDALEVVHDKGIIHRDIAPDNIFLAKNAEGTVSAKLIDFGASKFATTSHSKSLTVIIKPGYSPEEQYRSDGGQGTFTDVYALAAVMYRMVTGTVPPDAFERRTAIETNKKDLLKEPTDFNREVSEIFENALMNAINVKVEDRTASIKEFVSELEAKEPAKRRVTSIKKIDFMRWPLWAKITVPVVAIASLCLVIGLAMGIIQYTSNLALGNELPKGMTRVPELVNEDLTYVENLAVEAVLVINNIGGEYAPNIPENLVLSQDVMAGSIVMENTVVSVRVTTGEEIYIMPDVTGLTEENARMALECMGIEVSTVEGQEPGLQNGCVIRQSINAFTEIKRGESVELEVASGSVSQAGVVPVFVGMDFQDALKKAKEAGITVLVTEKRFGNDYKDGNILEQNITAGEAIQEGQVVELVSALAMREFSMPNLLYKNQATAIQILKNLGIKAETVNEYHELVAAGLVVSQGTKKEEKITPNTSVELLVSKGSKGFEMPDVVGQTEAEASEMLSAKGLSISIEYSYDENVAEGCIISQNVAPGSEVSKGTPVVIVVCSKNDLVDVPNVTGMTKENAIETLKALGLEVDVNEVSSYATSKGKVMDQLPKSGSAQIKGTKIILTIGKGDRKEEVNSAPDNSPSAWSGWVTSLPAGVTSSKYEIEEKTEYRYRTRETTSSTSQSSMEGWTLYNTEESWTNYGSWSAWSTTAVSQSNSRKVESKIQYRYRDKETTTSQSASLSGWTQSGSTSSWTSYGNWSNWQDSAVSASESRQVETRTVWGYYAYKCSNCGKRWHGYGMSCFTWDGGCGATVPESGWTATWSTISWNNAGLKEFNGTGKYYTTSLGDGLRWFKWSDNGNAKNQYRYRDRSKITTYSYWRWKEWSPYSDSVYTASSTREVQQQTVYRYADRSKVYTYYFEKWSSWSDYDVYAPSADGNTEIQSRVLYRYRKK